MNCQTFRTIVHEIDRPGRLDPTELNAALSHAQACGRCAQHLYHARDLAASLRVVASADTPGLPSPVVEGRLLAAFREQRSRSLQRRALAGWLAAAAALALGLAA